MLSKLFLILCLLSIAPSLSAKNILVLTDSHGFSARNKEGFGKKLVRDFESLGDQVFYYAATGATPYNWLASDKSVTTADQQVYFPSLKQWKSFPGAKVSNFNALFSQEKIDHVIILSGTNLYSLFKKESKHSELRTLIKRTGDYLSEKKISCTWVSPPDARDSVYPDSLQNSFLDFLAASLDGKCSVFNSLAVTHYDEVQENDSEMGIHHSPESATMWAREVFRSIAPLIHPPKKNDLAGQSVLRAIPLQDSTQDAVLRAIPVGETPVTPTKLKLISRSVFNEKPSTLTYPHLFLTYKYEVLKGEGLPKFIYIKHLGYRNREKQPAVDYPVGSILTANLIEESLRADLQTLANIDDLDFEVLPVFYVKEEASLL